MKERTVRDWLQRGTARGGRQRRKYQSDFDSYAPYVLKCWQEGQRNGMQIWREIAAQGYPGSSRMVYRFLETRHFHGNCALSRNASTASLLLQYSRLALHASSQRS